MLGLRLSRLKNPERVNLQLPSPGPSLRRRLRALPLKRELKSLVRRMLKPRLLLLLQKERSHPSGPSGPRKPEHHDVQDGSSYSYLELVSTKTENENMLQFSSLGFCCSHVTCFSLSAFMGILEGGCNEHVANHM